MKKLSQRRMVALELVKETGDRLCIDFCTKQRLPPNWQIVYAPGRAVSDYDGGGHRYEYDAVRVLIPEGKDHAGCLRHEIAFPAALDECAGYLGSKWGRVAWSEVLVAACWELREWIFEIGIPGDRESDLSSKLSD